MPIRFLLIAIFATSACVNALAADNEPRLLLQVDESSSGPTGGAKSRGCVRIYSDGRAISAHWSRAGFTLVDEAKKKTTPEKESSTEFKLDEFEAPELDQFLHSRAVRKLSSDFKPPHSAIDYFELTIVQIPVSDRSPKRITAREYYVASLVEKSRYPSALIVMLDKISEIEQSAYAKGKPTPPPADCKLRD
jgi:hypothetical protein